jgi:hypothetical protein
MKQPPTERSFGSIGSIGEDDSLDGLRNGGGVFVEIVIEDDV